MFKKMKMTNWKHVALSAVAITAMTGCGDTTISYGDSTVTITGDTINPSDPNNGGTTDVVLDLLTAAQSLPTETLTGKLAANKTLTSDKLWLLSGLVVVPADITLTVEPGTVIAGLPGDGDAASWMLVDVNGTIIADGTATEPIIFTSKTRVNDPSTNTVAQWGGLTIIGNAAMDGQITQYEVPINPVYSSGQVGTGVANDDSGILRNVHILNTGIGIGTGNTEINGLSLVAVGNGTTIENITIDYSGDDGIEIWGGTVNLTGVTISHCTDDHLDLDDGYSGTVKNFTINGSFMGYAGIEQSGDTYAHLEDFTINIPDQISEGGIYFKGSGIGGHFKNGVINYETDVSGAIYSNGTADLTNTSFENVTINALPGTVYYNKNNDPAFSADDIIDTFFTDPNATTFNNVVNEL